MLRYHHRRSDYVYPKFGLHALEAYMRMHCQELIGTPRPCAFTGPSSGLRIKSQLHLSSHLACRVVCVQSGIGLSFMKSSGQ